jgi:hypothetical protein
MNRRSEKGVALVLSILALLLLTAIAAGMMYMSTTETSVNNNFKSEEKAYFAARAGVEEVRDRMLFNNPSSICPMPPQGPRLASCRRPCLPLPVAFFTFSRTRIPRGERRQSPWPTSLTLHRHLLTTSCVMILRLMEQ